MGIRGELFSTKFPTKKRTYFFNVKENRNGDMFLNIVESKRQGEDSFERRSVIVFEEDLEVFEEELLKALEFVKSEKKKRK
ncbi:MAG: PUR family DNA/RNA-binding protein [Spirochaetia bacterium]|nr:PUR family DNA/RNA-binding protein [Spirochaetia bacterium]